MSNLLYTHNKNDLDRLIERTVKRTIRELHKTATFSTQSSTKNEDRLSQTQAANLLGITTASIIKLKKDKLIPYYQIGGTIFYSKKELLELARKNRVIKLKK